MTNRAGTLEQHLVDQRRPAGVPDAEIATLLSCVAEAVADLHGSLVEGGIYFYPAGWGHKNGKLRLLYECAPLAFVVERAGGAASTGGQRVLDVRAESIHQRVPFAIGSREDVARYERFVKAGAPA